jgi:serine/threonine protein kinase
VSRDSLPDLDPGARTGERFRVLGVLGRGATSTVYRAHDEASGGDVALKVLRSSLAAGTIAARRFEREAQLVGRLDHPAIVKLLATGFLTCSRARGGCRSRARSRSSTTSSTRSRPRTRRACSTATSSRRT